MPPGNWRTVSVTPSEPLPPTPAGQEIAPPVPTLDFHSGETAERYVVKAAVVPEPSVRWATTTLSLGRLTPGLSFLMSGSCQLVILPRKIPEMVSAESWRGLVRPGRL